MIFLIVCVHYVCICHDFQSAFPEQFPVAEVLSAAELFFSLDLEVMSFGHSTSSLMWHYKFNCSEKTRFLL